MGNNQSQPKVSQKVKDVHDKPYSLDQAQCQWWAWNSEREYVTKKVCEENYNVPSLESVKEEERAGGEGRDAEGDSTARGEEEREGERPRKEPTKINDDRAKKGTYVHVLIGEGVHRATIAKIEDKRWLTLKLIGEYNYVNGAWFQRYTTLRNNSSNIKWDWQSKRDYAHVLQEAKNRAKSQALAFAEPDWDAANPGKDCDDELRKYKSGTVPETPKVGTLVHIIDENHSIFNAQIMIFSTRQNVLKLKVNGEDTPIYLEKDSPHILWNYHSSAMREQAKWDYRKLILDGVKENDCSFFTLEPSAEVPEQAMDGRRLADEADSHEIIISLGLFLFTFMVFNRVHRWWTQKPSH